METHQNVLTTPFTRTAEMSPILNISISVILGAKKFNFSSVTHTLGVQSFSLMFHFLAVCFVIMFLPILLRCFVAKLD
jgi:hypothetical protein